jgi:hypothetical protein
VRSTSDAKAGAKFRSKEAPAKSSNDEQLLRVASRVRPSYTYANPQIAHTTATMAKTENDIREKKEKKDKKRKADDEVKEEADEERAVMTVPVGALVPFANPLADEKQQKKVLKAVKKCMRQPLRCQI